MRLEGENGWEEEDVREGKCGRLRTKYITKIHKKSHNESIIMCHYYIK